MAIASQHLGKLALPLLLLASGVHAQPSGNDPALQLIRGGGTPAVFKPGQPILPSSSCPAIVRAGNVQPMRLPPSEVSAKNKLGCLSPNDAIYGSDGCPTRLCGDSNGAVPLPMTGGSAGTQPQLPEP